MSTVNQTNRHIVRPAQLPSSDKLKGSAEGGSNDSGHTQAGVQYSGKTQGSLLGVLDSQSRRSALGDDEPSTASDSKGSGDTGDHQGSQLDSSTQSRAAVNTAIATDSTGIDASNSAIASDASGLEAAKAAMQKNLKDMASDPSAFHETMKKSFGENYNREEAESIRQQVLNDDFSWMPEIRVVDESVLQDQSGGGQALGAYSKDSDTIFISKQLLESNPEKAAAVLTEEVGHGLDARLNTEDAAGDEGNIFARLVGGETISDSELSALKAENDSGTIIVDGKEVEVEFFLKKAFKAVTKPFRAVGKAVKKGFKAIKDGVSKAWSGIKKGFKKLMQSKLFNTILMVAQFIPIPVVQVAVRVINAVKAAYQVYQGVKHGSVGMVLGGVAGAAGAIGSAGQMLGASQGFVNTAAKIANGARTAGAAYQAVAKGNFAAAAGLASNYFGGTDTDVGRAFGTASRVAGAIDSAEKGDYLGAISQGRAAYSTLNSNDTAGGTTNSNSANGSDAGASSAAAPQRSGFLGFVDDIKGIADDVKGSKTYQAIVNNVDNVRSIVKAAKSGDYTQAANVFLTNYADDLGIDKNAQTSIMKWTGVVEQVDSTRNLIKDGDYASAIDQAAGLLGIPMSENNSNRLHTVFQIRDSVLGDKYALAARQASSLAMQSGRPDIAQTFFQLANLLESARVNPAVNQAA
ncbi:MAG: hypothetical protein KTR32_33450 [Granulosicoccus sp.]|nr:hypothetical protein [Granulosicoccus sp.]